jgi:hypothetical protein
MATCTPLSLRKGRLPSSTDCTHLHAMLEHAKRCREEECSKSSSDAGGENAATSSIPKLISKAEPLSPRSSTKRARGETAVAARAPGVAPTNIPQGRDGSGDDGEAGEDDSSDGVVARGGGPRRTLRRAAPPRADAAAALWKNLDHIFGGFRAEEFAPARAAGASASEMYAHAGLLASFLDQEADGVSGRWDDLEAMERERAQHRRI